MLFFCMYVEWGLEVSMGYYILIYTIVIFSSSSSSLSHLLCYSVTLLLSLFFSFLFSIFSIF